MNTTDTVLLLRRIKAYRPAQIFDDLTAEGWAELLEDIRYEDAVEGVVAYVRMKPDFITPDIIRDQVTKIRNKRIADHPPVEPPPGLTVPQYLEWQRQTNKRIGDGEQLADTARGPLHARPMPPSLTGRPTRESPAVSEDRSSAGARVPARGLR